MASPIQWIWVWVNSGSWWWTGKPGMLQSMGSQRIRYDRVTELNWNFKIKRESYYFFTTSDLLPLSKSLSLLTWIIAVASWSPASTLLPHRELGMKHSRMSEPSWQSQESQITLAVFCSNSPPAPSLNGGKSQNLHCAQQSPSGSDPSTSLTSALLLPQPLTPATLVFKWSLQWAKQPLPRGLCTCPSAWHLLSWKWAWASVAVKRKNIGWVFLFPFPKNKEDKENSEQAWTFLVGFGVFFFLL